MKFVDVCVIIPTADPNRKNLLIRALKSIHKQTYKPKEVFIVDNHKNLSNNNTINFFNKKYGTNFKYFKYLKKGGGFGVRNYFSKNCKSKYLAFLDDDDYWSKNYLKRFYEINLKEKSDLYVCETINVNEKFIKLYNFYIPLKFEINKIGLRNPGIRASSTILNKKTFLEMGGYDLKLSSGSGDKDLLLRIIKKGFKYTVIKERLVYYTIHKNQHSKNFELLYKSSKEFYNKNKNDLNFLDKIRFKKKILIFYIKKLFLF
jgi:glycosyltransferase involved in cell wall biosynthesis